MKRSWIVVANASLARIFVPAPHGALHLLESMTHAQSRLHAQELAEAFGAGAAARDHRDDRFAARDGVRRKEHLRFARTLARRLDKGLADRAYESLTLIAAKPFLGELRQQLSEAVNGRIALALNSDLTALNPAELSQRLAGGAAGRLEARSPA